MKSRRTSSYALHSTRYTQPFWSGHNPGSTVTSGFNSGFVSGINTGGKPGSAASDFNYNQEFNANFNLAKESRGGIGHSQVRKPKREIPVPSKNLNYLYVF